MEKTTTQLRKFAVIIIGIILQVTYCRFLTTGIKILFLSKRRDFMKKTKKTILALLLTGALIFSAFILGGCGEKDGLKSSDLISATDSNGTKWPDSSVAQILPVPKSTKWEIKKDSYNSLYVIVHDTTLTDFDEYVSNCKERGFNEKYQKGEKWYEAEKTDKDNNCKYSLNLKYFEDKKEIGISNNLTEEETTALTTEKPTQETTNKPTVASTKAPATTAAAQKSGDSAQSKSKYSSIFSDNLNKYKILVETYKQKLETVYNTLGNSYDSYTSNVSALEEWYSSLENDYQGLFDETGNVTATYFEKVKTEMAGSDYNEWDTETDYIYDDYHDGVMDDLYDEIYDGMLDDLYDKYYDDVLYDQPENVEYSDYSKVRSNFYKKWNNAKSTFYKKWSNAKSTFYKAWSKTRSDLYK